MGATAVTRGSRSVIWLQVLLTSLSLITMLSTWSAVYSHRQDDAMDKLDKTYVTLTGLTNASLRVGSPHFRRALYVPSDLPVRAELLSLV